MYWNALSESFLPVVFYLSASNGQSASCTHSDAQQLTAAFKRWPAVSAQSTIWPEAIPPNVDTDNVKHKTAREPLQATLQLALVYLDVEKRFLSFREDGIVFMVLDWQCRYSSSFKLCHSGL